MSHTPTDRLSLLIKSLKISGTELANKLGTSQPTISAILNGKRTLSRGMIARISSALPEVNPEWLLTGEGQMFKETNVERISISSYKEPATVRFFEISPSATFKEFLGSPSATPEYITISPSVGTHIDESNCVFQIHGESMAPQIQHGAKILCREVMPSKWHTLRDTIVVIAYGDSFVIKRIIHNHLETDNYIVLASDNPDFPEQVRVPLNSIYSIFQAIEILNSPLH